MHNRLLSQFAFVGLSLSLGLAATSAARAEEPVAPNPITQLSAQHDDEASQPPTEVKVKTVNLAAADVGTEKRRLPNRPLLLTSSLVFGAGYVPTFITAMANSKNTTGNLYIPVVGPWIEIGKDTSPGNRALLVFSGLLQGAGAIGILSSFFVPESRTKKMPLVGRQRFSVTPVAGRGVYSLSAQGRF
jgi:hypothetical protein